MVCPVGAWFVLGLFMVFPGFFSQWYAMVCTLVGYGLYRVWLQFVQGLAINCPGFGHGLEMVWLLFVQGLAMVCAGVKHGLSNVWLGSGW